MAESCNIRVICRFRPLNDREIAIGENSDFIQYSGKSVTIRSPKKDEVFNFDAIFGANSTCTQEEIWKEVGEVGVKEVTKGFTATIFAYGQTGSGKTWTMFGSDLNSPNRGIIPRACQTLFEFIHKDTTGIEFQVKCSFLEIYKEIIKDLLNPRGGSNLKVREIPSRGVWVEGLTEQYVSSVEEIIKLLDFGEASRSRAFTQMNAQSSRSHSLFTITLIQKFKDGSEKIGKLNLADLADYDKGSEKISKTGATGDTLEEAKKINQSLSALGNCIHALSSGKKSHVPYRDSKLTFVLRESLGGNAKTTLVIACSPHVNNIEESLSALRFGQRAKTIKNTAKAHIHRSVEELNLIITKLQKELTALKKYSKHLESIISEYKKDFNPEAAKKEVMGASYKETDQEANSFKELSKNNSNNNNSNYNNNNNNDANGYSDYLDEEEIRAEEEENNDYNPVSVVELQLELQKLREESEFNSSQLKEQLDTSKKNFEEKEKELKEVQNELYEHTQSSFSIKSKFDELSRESHHVRDLLEKKLYEQSILIEEQKQQIASGSGYSNRFKEEEYRLNVEELNKEIQRLLKENGSLSQAVESMARRNNEISDSIKKDLDEKSKQIQQDNVNLNKLVEDMGNTMNLQQSTIVQLRDTVSDLKNQIKFREEKEMMQPDVRDVTKLEIALEGEKRINLIQSNRCDQLTKRVEELETELSSIKEEKNKIELAQVTQQRELQKAKLQLQQAEENDFSLTPPSPVRVVKPIHQHRSISVILGSRKKRRIKEGLPNRSTISSPIKEGWLFKQGAIVRSWKKRWFVLRSVPPTLYYFENTNSPEPHGSIPLDDCVLETSDVETKRSFTFAVYHSSRRTFYIQASSIDDRNSWMEAINNLLHPKKIDTNTLLHMPVTI